MICAAALVVLPASAQDETASDSDVQDMSDPLAVYTQVGAGVTNKGINLKAGRSYDTGSPTTMAMNVLEAKGLLGEAVGWDSGSVRDNSADSLRLRNFKVDLTNGRGGQLDVSYNFDENYFAEESGTISYGVMQALPKFGSINIYPLVGLGLAFGNNVLEDDGSIDSGYSIPGTYALAGMYGKWAITDKVWMNYNPFFLATLSGSDIYKDNAYGAGNDNVLTHEIALSYQISPVFNVRYFANFTDEVDFADGDHRVEFNYQL
ncbi:hypothetical protein EY643_09020 [Halioglobus maricola]|uniref:Uncharacterized protein n=2 Tax=Halioglobus maricola TaxID=2601894 RepID=A0A5P9NRV4_9GAMM|nr:hypothetical protein EY643_09020 [Halioglobus maricola]